MHIIKRAYRNNVTKSCVDFLGLIEFASETKFFALISID